MPLQKICQKNEPKTIQKRAWYNDRLWKWKSKPIPLIFRENLLKQNKVLLKALRTKAVSLVPWKYDYNSCISWIRKKKSLKLCR